MALTTAAAVRDAMRNTVRALTPSTLAMAKFRPFIERTDFRSYCEANTTAAFRAVSIRDRGELLGPVVSNMEREWVETEFECAVAYPHDFKTGKDLYLDLDDCLELDLRQIEHAIGTNGYSGLDVTTGGDATVTTTAVTRDVGEVCTFGVLRLAVRYWRAMP